MYWQKSYASCCFPRAEILYYTDRPRAAGWVRFARTRTRTHTTEIELINHRRRDGVRVACTTKLRCSAAECRGLYTAGGRGNLGKKWWWGMPVVRGSGYRARSPGRRRRRLGWERSDASYARITDRRTDRRTDADGRTDGRSDGDELRSTGDGRRRRRRRRWLRRRWGSIFVTWPPFGRRS